MWIRRTSGAVLAACFSASLVALAAQATADLPVTSLISDYDSGTAPALQIQSDKAGVYSDSRTLTSVIQSPGAWVLDSLNPKNSTRTVYLGFNLPVAGSGPNGGTPVAVPSTLYKAKLYAKCNAANYQNSMLTLAPGATIPCPLRVEFDAGGQRYWLRMNPYTGEDQGSYPETNYVNITCIYPTSGANPCSQWRIEPSGTYTAPDQTIQKRNVAVLLLVTTSKGKTIYVKQGDFYFSFLFLVTNP